MKKSLDERIANWLDGIGPKDGWHPHTEFVNEIIADRKLLLFVLNEFKKAIAECKPKSLGVATVETGKCWCLKDEQGQIVGSCSQCPIHGTESDLNQITQENKK